MLYKSEEELLYKATQAEGKTFGQIDQSGRIQNEKSKGNLGHIIEESYFGYEINSSKDADFSDLGIELKVTGIKKNKNGTLSAKERLVLNIINYEEEAKKDFYTSSFWMNNNHLLIIFYKWIPNVSRADYKIIKAHLHKFSPEDLEIIKQDWEVISDKINSGIAHKISEADTNYLAASTKGANRNSTRKQPFSDVPAMQRAYSLKQSYMTALVRNLIQKEDLVRFTTSEELQRKTFANILLEKFSPYVGLSISQISSETGIDVNTKSKHFLQQFVSNLLGIKGTKLSQIEEFSKSNIQLKTIRLEKNGIPKEHMSFKNVDFIEWSNETWEESWVKNYFEETKFLFVVFEYKETKAGNPYRELYFKGIKLWNLPLEIIDNKLFDFWQHVQSLIQVGLKLTEEKQKSRIIVRNNLPKPGNNELCHIRPKARNGQDRVQLPDGRFITKQAFWFDNEFIGKLLKELD